jgi:riboflavin biosynthesis pyrimidine reductase
MHFDFVKRLYPGPQRDIALKGLYLHGTEPGNQDPLVYTNFITSLDGRIAIDKPAAHTHGVPDMITNPRDWRLYQELAARADVLLVSGRYIRELAQETAQAGLPLSAAPEFSDLHTWRKQQGLSAQPAVVILSASLDLPPAGMHSLSDRRVYVATGEEAPVEAVNRIERAGINVIQAGRGRQVDGSWLVQRLRQSGYKSIYSIGGPQVLEILLRSRVLDRLYLTQVFRLIGGMSYDTLLDGELLTPPTDFELHALYYDEHGGEGCCQMFSVYRACA